MEAGIFAAAHTPNTTGSKQAAVPVLDRTEDNPAPTSITADQHNADHQTVFTGTGKSDDGFTDFLGQAGVEHSSAYDEHACKQNNGGVGQAAEHLLSRDKSQQAAGDRAGHSGNCQRDNFSNEE